MEIKRLLRRISKRLFDELTKEVFVPFKPSALQLPRGAGGDRTYPIDKKAEEIIISGLEASGIPLSILSEEAGLIELKGGGKTVLIDPIDGSRNAVSGIPFYCTSIAIADGNKVKDIELSYVINLVNHDEFWAQKGKGAFLNGNPICTQKDDEMRLLAYEAQVPGRDIPKIIPLLSKFHRTRCLGATALDLAYLSEGGISIFVTPSLSRCFDFAGGWLLVKEAGGIFTDIEGKEVSDIELSLKKATSILASGNKMLHEKALTALKKPLL
ncbi:MAG: hypothetical protein HY805_02870 [Nitrospirae bacterium]|nr:hypothetical protein [Nitrospirota bacterium]